jgi:hypothetical protein
MISVPLGISLLRSPGAVGRLEPTVTSREGLVLDGIMNSVLFCGRKVTSVRAHLKRESTIATLWSTRIQMVTRKSTP